jgi:dTDP-4-dehydrorhamnose 3,5-epimerase
MSKRALSVGDCFEFQPTLHGDDRGVFLEWFRQDELEAATGRSLGLLQANLSVSRRGVTRGIHFSDVPPGQAKYVIAASGSILDFAVDLRVGSPTFGAWDVVELDDVSRRAVFLSEGIGHAFVTLSDSATVCYLTTDVYKPASDRSLLVTDPELGLDLRLPHDEIVLSPKDAEAPALASLLSDGLLPDYATCVARYSEAASA